MKPIEQLTLAEIRLLKKDLAGKIGRAVAKILNEFEKEYGIAAEVTDVWTERKVYHSEQGAEVARLYSAYAHVKFDGEEIDDDRR